MPTHSICGTTFSNTTEKLLDQVREVIDRIENPMLLKTPSEALSDGVLFDAILLHQDEKADMKSGAA